MLSKWVCIIVNLIVSVIAITKDENIRAFIKITELEYEDTCLSTSEAEWAFINTPSNETLLSWVNFHIINVINNLEKHKYS